MSYEPDEKDLKVIELLEQNSKLTTRQLAKKTLLPPTTINNRIRKLNKEGIIKQYTIIPDYKQLGKGVLIYLLISANLLQLKTLKRTQYDIVNDLKKLEQIQTADIVTSGTDIVATIRVANLEEYDQLLLRKIQLIEGIENTRSLIVIH